MNKKILKNSRTRVLTLMLAVAGIISLGILMQSCSKDEEDPPLDDVILNSSELEEYIIAGADFQQSLTIFTEELNNVDFSKLEVAYDTEGRKVRHLPAGSVSIRIEEKVQTFNNRKEALRKKFPQFASFGEEMGKKYFQHSIQNSVNVKGAFLKLGINTTRPKLKSGNEQNGSYHFMDECYLEQFLSWWMISSGYAELAIIFYADGTIATYLAPGASSGQTSSPPMTSSNGNIYYTAGGSSSPVVEIAHTHTTSIYPSTYPPGHPQAGQISEGIVSGMPNSIYYNGNIRCFYNCF